MGYVLHLFSRNLRLYDNLSLNAALESGHTVVPCFIFTEAMHMHPFSYQFIADSLRDLEQEITKQGGRLHIFKGDPVVVLTGLLKRFSCRDVYVQKDYTPDFQEFCMRLAEACTIHAIDNHLIVPPEDNLKSDGSPYRVFTPFLRSAREKDVRPPQHMHRGKWYTGDISGTSPISDAISHGEACCAGGRKSGLEVLSSLNQITSYADTRDYPFVPTSRLSPHSAWGTLSIREIVFEAASMMGIHSVFIDELYWRDFWFHIANHFPHVFTNSFISKYDKLPWSHDEELFSAWCTGHTGFPIVDAGMRELNQTGFMHNRVRMITASFLTKDLHISWRQGEQYFASRLIDWDPCVNNGNWQWAASTGCDAQPFFRIFNPWSQQKKFDSETRYIKQWVPELTSYSSKEIHDHGVRHLPHYPQPIVDHSQERVVALSHYRSVSEH